MLVEFIASNGDESKGFIEGWEFTQHTIDMSPSFSCDFSMNAGATLKLKAQSSIVPALEHNKIYRALGRNLDDTLKYAYQDGLDYVFYKASPERFGPPAPPFKYARKDVTCWLLEDLGFWDTDNCSEADWYDDDTHWQDYPNPPGHPRRKYRGGLCGNAVDHLLQNPLSRDQFAQVVKKVR